MKPESRLSVAISSASLSNGATNTLVQVDTSPSGGPRARYIVFDIDAGTPNVVSNKPSVLKIQQSDTTDATNFADISGTVAGTDYTLANASTSVENLYKFLIDLRGKKRYLQAVISPRTTVTVFALANLFWTDQAPSTTTKANVLALIAV